MSRKVGIVRFLGTNCDRDIWQSVKLIGGEPQWLWYQDQFEGKDLAGIIIPGGFSYGDYLRCGALAGKAPVMKSVKESADKGIPVLGICNGFQILCETGLLEGALVRNENLRFIDNWVSLKMDNPCGPWGSGSVEGEFSLPIAHGEGRYVAEEDVIKELEDQGQVWMRYLQNPNGSIGDIAGVLNKNKNVAGLMPHPERAVFPWMGSDLGLKFFQSVIH